MHITITSDSTEDVSLKLREILVNFENLLNKNLESKSYGKIDRFMVVAVAVTSDIVEDNLISKGHSKIGSYRHPISLVRTRFISVALTFDPKVIMFSTADQLFKNLSLSLMRKLDNICVRIPKGFKYSEFSADMRAVIEAATKEI